MRRFRFRADVALDIRRRALDRAQRDLARAEEDRLDASRRADQAGAAVSEARRAAIPAAGRLTSPAMLQWYRFWILRLEHERRQQESALDARVAAVGAASAACVLAQQRCRALERLREKARARHDAAEAADERKTIDEVAARRADARRRS
jgi:flagellar export protein FliJ